MRTRISIVAAGAVVLLLALMGGQAMAWSPAGEHSFEGFVVTSVQGGWTQECDLTLATTLESGEGNTGSVDSGSSTSCGVNAPRCLASITVQGNPWPLAGDFASSTVALEEARFRFDWWGSGCSLNGAYWVATGTLDADYSFGSLVFNDTLPIVESNIPQLIGIPVEIQGTLSPTEEPVPQLEE